MNEHPHRPRMRLDPSFGQLGRQASQCERPGGDARPQPVGALARERAGFVAADLSRLAALATRSTWSDDYLTRNLTEISRFVGETSRLEAVRGRDYDGLESDVRTIAR